MGDGGDEDDDDEDVQQLAMQQGTNLTTVMIETWVGDD